MENNSILVTNKIKSKNIYHTNNQTCTQKLTKRNFVKHIGSKIAYPTRVT